MLAPGAAAKLLVLEDCHSDFRTPPFDDAVLAFTTDGKLLGKVGGLNICQTIGACRSLSVAAEGRFFVVCENVANKLTAYETGTRKPLWSLNGKFTSALVSRTGLIYALTNAGTIYGSQLLVINQQGQIVKSAALGGFDLALAPDGTAIWLVGSDIKRCDLDLNILLKLTPVRWCAVSVDANADDSVWVAERQHPNIAQSQDRIIKISPRGKIRATVNLAWSPFCVRVDRADGSVWVTGTGVQPGMTKRLLDSIEKRTGRWPLGKGPRDFLSRPNVWSRTQKHDAQGKLLVELDHGGFSLEVDQTDSSLWLAGKEKVYHYSSSGAKLASFPGLSGEQKYIAIVPGARATNEINAQAQP